MSDGTDLPSPLTPCECDISDWPGMMVDIARLQKSRAWLYCKTKPHLNLAFHLFNLWMAAWHGTPAGSLEDDDEVLSDIAKCRDLEHWMQIRDEVLRGFVLCSDGRWYHNVIAAKVLELWLQKLGSRISSGHGNATKHKTKFDDTHLRAQIESARTALLALDPDSNYFTKRGVAIQAKAGKPVRKPKASKPAPNSLPPGDSQEPDGVATEDKKREGKGITTVGGEPPTTPGAGAPGGQADPGGIPTGETPAGDTTLQTRGAPVPGKIEMADYDLPLPDWLAPHAEAWNAFQEIRRKNNKKAPYTRAAQKGILRELQKFHGEGQDLTTVLMASVNSGWTGVFAQRGSARRPVVATGFANKNYGGGDLERDFAG